MSATSSYAQGGAAAAAEVVTGEAVVLDLPPASMPLRAVGTLVDLVVSTLALIALLLLVVLTSSLLDDALGQAVAILATAAVLIGLPTTVETLTRGRSLGKLLTGLRVVREDGGTISFQHAFVRALVGVVEIYALSGTPAAIAASLDGRGRRLGDHAAGTYVVRDRVSWAPSPPPAMPPGMGAWAQSIDLRPLPADLALAMRHYVERGHTLVPATAQLVGERLLGSLGEHVAPPPPPGSPPVVVLAAVLAERNTRERARLARQDELRRRLTGR